MYVLLKLGFCPGLRLAGRTQAFLYRWEGRGGEGRGEESVGIAPARRAANSRALQRESAAARARGSPLDRPDLLSVDPTCARSTPVASESDGQFSAECSGLLAS